MTQITTNPWTAAPWMRAETALHQPVSIGERGPEVRLVQELLAHHGLHLAIDGVFGPATRAAVERFQRLNGWRDGDGSGVVEAMTLAALTAPFRRAIEVAPAPGGFGEALADTARRHLAERPREIGGQNRGPWVRLYMRGHEGAAYPWCAGFVSTLAGQTALRTGQAPPLDWTMSCDLLAADAQARGRFIDGGALSLPGPRRPAVIRPGSIFLIRRRFGDWTHTGIVTAAGEDHFETIEGNTNDEGSREGYEVCERIRAYGAVDFVRVDG